ncbi:related to splicing factor HCC1 [Serendipita indica DSM 11827]|uniref:Related to splicing factor HCC1 n=1 Tax=Serendipita indica (strain DSM 11827) TaxID=1109443 RepID=G4TF82_SERID|nr:related to splicing factor HCC1 [Serendipita indica DSM 11827]
MSTEGMEVDKQSEVKSSANGSQSGRRSHRSRSRGSDRRDRDRDRDRHYSEHRDRGDKDRDRRRSDRDRDRSRDRRHRDDDRYRERRDRDRDDRDRSYRSSRNYSRDRDSRRDDDDRREKRRREDGDEGAPEGKRRKEDQADSPNRSERRDQSRDSDRRRRDRHQDSGRRDYDRRPSRASPKYVPPTEDFNEEEAGDSEQRSVFVTQLAARLTARDLGYFFEEKLGDGAVRDARIVTDRLSRRSKGIGYVELRSLDLVSKAIALTGTVVMGLPIKVQLTEAERNRIHSGDLLNLPPGVTATSHGPMQLYVGSLHFQLTEEEIKQVFEPFGELEFVDLHRDPATGRSKGYCFIQYRRPEDAKMALEQMDGFELAGRQLRVNTVHEKGVAAPGGVGMSLRAMGNTAESLDEGGGNLNAVSRQALMQKLARTNEPQIPLPVSGPKINIKSQETRCILLKNAFDPAEETDPDWDKNLQEDVVAECESKFQGRVEKIVVEKDSKGEIYIQCDSIDMAKRAVANLDGRWFGGRQISASYISDAIMRAHGK